MMMCSKNTMLIADDLDINRDVLKEMFKNEFDILEAEDGRECVELIEKYGKKIHILLLDIQMPVMTGLEVLEYRKGNPVFSEIPVIVITINDEIRDQMAAFQLGATDYITKPFIREIVIYRINNVLSSKKRVDEIVKEKENLQIKTELDLMTGLYNKVTAEHLISSILAKNNKINAMMIIDIDNFKQVNDFEGHLVGDHTIRIIADLISGHFRKSDIVGRVGGDEFIVFMVDIPSGNLARQKANDLARLLRYKPNITLPANVSISIGLIVTEEHTYEYEELFKKADQALYCAKRNGKGQYIEYGREMEEDYSEKGSMAALLFSRDKQICGSIKLINDEIRLIEVLSPDDVRYAGDQYAGDIRLLYIDISKEKDDGKGLIKQIMDISWLKDIPFFAICREGDMNQFSAAIQSGARDLITVPIDITFARRRTAKFFAGIPINTGRRNK